MKLFGRKSSSDNSSNASAPQESTASTDQISTPVQSTDSIAKPTTLSDKPVRVRIPAAKLDKTKRELKTLLFEKELASAALTRLYEAEASGEITKEERETLAVRYRDQLKDLDSRIVTIDAFIEVGDLEFLRDQLVELVRQKIDQIEKRIERTRPLASPLLEQENLSEKKVTPQKPAPEVTKPRVPDISSLLSKKVSPAPASPQEREPIQVEQVVQAASGGEVSNSSTESQDDAPKHRKRNEPASSTSSDDEVDQLQKELRDALDRLDKLDLET